MKRAPAFYALPKWSNFSQHWENNYPVFFAKKRLLYARKLMALSRVGFGCGHKLFSAHFRFSLTILQYFASLILNLSVPTRKIGRENAPSLISATKKTKTKKRKTLQKPIIGRTPLIR